MPRKDPSATKQPQNKQNRNPQQHPDYLQRQSPSNYAPQYQQQDSSYHQSTPSRNYPKPKIQKTDTKRQHVNRPPKYQSINPPSDQNSNRQYPSISRIRKQNIDIQGSNQSRKMEKVTYSKQPNQNIKASNQVGKLVAQINHSRQVSKEQPSANTPQERKIRDLHANMQKLSESLLDLRENYENFEKQEIKYSNLKNSQIYDSKHTKTDNNKNNSLVRYHSQLPKQISSKSSIEEALNKSKVAPKTNQEILQFLLEKQRQKEERKKKMAIISEQSRKKIEEQLMQRNKREEQYVNWRKSQIRAAHNFDQKHRQQREIEQNRKKAAEQYAKQIKDKKYKYLPKKQQLQQKLQKEFDEKREKVVNQRKQMNKPIDSQEIEEHQKWFEAKRQELLDQKRMLRQDSLQRIQEDNSNLPEFWKGNAHSIAQEERNRIKQKLKQPYEKAQKIKDYREYIQEKFKPKSPKQAQQNLLNIFDPSKFREVKRYRYYKGVSYGQIAQTVPVAKDAKEIMRIGNSNMELMKKIPKKRNLTTQLYSATPQPQRKFDMNLVRNIFSSVVEKQKAKSSKIQLPENLKCYQLQAVVDKIRSQSIILYDKEKYLSLQGNKNGRNQQEQRELVDGLVNNIELKLNLLSQL